MKANIIAGLDIGSSSVKMMVARKTEDARLEVLGFAQESSSGMRKGAVVKQDEVARRIAAVKARAENVSSQKIDEVAVNLGGSHVFVTSSRGVVAVSRADGEISQEDVDRVLDAAQAFSLPSNKEILEVFPKEFLVDGEGSVKEPVGMRGIRLETEVLALCAFSPYLKNLTDAVLSSGLGVADVVPVPLATAEAVLTNQQKELGVAVLNIGAGTTSLAVFQEGDLLHLAVFPVGSDHITNDIAIGLRTEPEVAERIKVEFGTLGVLKGKRTEKIELEDGTTLSFSLKMLSHIIEARMKEILGLVAKDLKTISKQADLPAGIILAGGGAKLPKIAEFVKKEMRLPAKIGQAQGILGPQEDPELLEVMGLVLKAARNTES
ncbi:MAG: cell division protein FtsA, partial [Candidatus Pacearchaeota archaeon]|nr:cell division protein FtsA [Candidatus Pacearchaeota archaeon]